MILLDGLMLQMLQKTSLQFMIVHEFLFLFLEWEVKSLWLQSAGAQFRCLKDEHLDSVFVIQ